MFSIFIRTVIFYILLNILLKIMGKRQIGELEVSELVRLCNKKDTRKAMFSGIHFVLL